MEIVAQLHTFIRKRNGQCKVAAAPTDVQLDCDEKTMIQPDLFVICDRSKILKTQDVYKRQPYSSEEIVTREFVIQEKPKGIINIVAVSYTHLDVYKRQVYSNL